MLSANCSKKWPATPGSGIVLVHNQERATRRPLKVKHVDFAQFHHHVTNSGILVGIIWVLTLFDSAKCIKDEAAECDLKGGALHQQWSGPLLPGHGVAGIHPCDLVDNFHAQVTLVNWLPLAKSTGFTLGLVHLWFSLEVFSMLG